MFLRLAFGKPLHQLSVAAKKQPERKIPHPPETGFACFPFHPLKFNLTCISLGDNIITTSDNGG
jgi:hypothetical protein